MFGVDRIRKRILALSSHGMDRALGMLIAVVVIVAGACDAAEVLLKSNAPLRLEFPELPETLATMLMGEKQPARLTAQLPENYSLEGTFPLFAFLHGGHGADMASPTR